MSNIQDKLEDELWYVCSLAGRDNTYTNEYMETIRQLLDTRLAEVWQEGRDSIGLENPYK